VPKPEHVLKLRRRVLHDSKKWTARGTCVLPHSLLAQSVRTVSFDTAGLGFSDPGRLPRTTDAIVSDLHAALTAEGIGPPYVLVGHSAGGLRMRRFAALYPEQVAGMVLVDSVTEDWEHRIYGGPCPGMVAERVGFRRMLALARLGQLTPETPDYRERVGLPRPELTPAVNKALHGRARPTYGRRFRRPSDPWSPLRGGHFERMGTSE
jgi:pimeloyl-ACP methyl ester carboxylesterase